MSAASDRSISARAPGIDAFRLAAAWMIVAIHTAPLASVSKTADQLFTYGFCRIGVPFFFMVTGYFVLGPALFQEDTSGAKLRRHLKKMVFLYAISALLYLPVMIYAGQLAEFDSIGSILKAIVFDGTFYHLWYLPASVIGTLLVAACAKKMKARRLLFLTCVLYLIGLGGDTYYGLAEQSRLVQNFYKVLFTFSTYTRNGIFFAPVFLYLGALLSQKRKLVPVSYCVIGFTLSLAGMLSESFFTYQLAWQRHNSMYIMLPAAMLFLFEGLLHIKGKAVQKLPPISMWIYVLHPLCIIIARGFAKFFKMTGFLIENSIIHYLFICLLSLLAAAAAEYLVKKRKMRNKICIKRDGRG